VIVIIAGGRDYQPTQESAIWLDQMHQQLGGIQGVVYGGAPGADDFGRRWAQDLDIPVKLFAADWNKHGPAAGPIRNQQMADFLLLYPRRAVLLFPGGRGTSSMRNIAKTAGIEVFEFPRLTG
jgi:hypothetical protein